MFGNRFYGRQREKGAVRIRFPATPESIPEARRLLTGHLTSLGFSGDVVESARLALTEATANVVRHAYRTGAPGDFDVVMSLFADRLVVVVSDGGVGPSPHPTGGGIGMGIPLMSAFAQKLEIEGDPDHGTTVRMTFSLSPTLPQANTNGHHPST